MESYALIVAFTAIILVLMFLITVIALFRYNK